MEGFWTVEFHAAGGMGGGVAVFRNGQVLGGDSGYQYRGTYDVRGDQLRGTVQVSRFLQGVPSVFGNLPNFTLQLEGRVANGSAEARGQIVGNPQQQIRIRLTKQLDLN
jgi:hypothetical protein